MQQYFINDELNINKTISLNEDIVFHLTKVLRNSENTFRLVDSKHKVFLAELINNNAHILEEIKEDNESKTEITAVIATIKQDKFEIVLQKLTELGVKRIIPVKTSYSQNLYLNDKKIVRFNKIIQEAAEQSHRNIIPQLLDEISLKDVVNYKSDLNIVAYEKETGNNISLKSSSVTFIIGPEGGFTKEEIDFLISYDFKSITLGKTILRAETAAITITSNINWENK